MTDADKMKYVCISKFFFTRCLYLFEPFKRILNLAQIPRFHHDLNVRTASMTPSNVGLITSWVSCEQFSQVHSLFSLFILRSVTMDDMKYWWFTVKQDCDELFAKKCKRNVITGKWTVEEEIYAARLIDDVTKQWTILPPRTTINKHLAEHLNW